MRLHKIIPSYHETKYKLIFIFAISVFIVFVLFVWQGNKGFNLWDEGFLWYGAQRVMQGGVPIRDFLSYDPGRYYWSAWIMEILGNNSIIALREAVATFQVFGLFIGVLLIANSFNKNKKENLLYLIVSAIVLVVWMYPRHKLFDISLSIMLVGSLAFLIQNPTSRRYFVTGTILGLVAVFGRNHGVYGLIGTILAMIWLSIRNDHDTSIYKGFAFWSIGVITGFLPILLMMVFVPGFGEAFWKGVIFILKIKSTNLALPIPWPWNVNFKGLPLGDAIRSLLTGLFFIGMLVFPLIANIWAFRKRIINQSVQPVLVSAIFLSVPYTQYAYSRADINHLAQSIFPLLIGLLILISYQSKKIKWILVTMLVSASIWIMYIYQPGFQCINNYECTVIKITGDNVIVDKNTAGKIRELRKLTEKYAPGDNGIIVTPLMVSAYPLLNKKSPLRDIYGARSRSKKFQLEEIQRIKKAKVTFIIIFDIALDGRNELRYKHTHPLIYKYITQNFQRIKNSPYPDWQLYKKKG